MADPIKMTRAEYQAKFGTAPAVASTPTVTTPPTPATPSIDTTAAPVKMTRAEYAAKFGAAPEITPTAPAETPGYFSRVGSEIKGAFQGLQKTTGRGAELMQEGKPVQGAVMSGLGAPAAFIRAAFSPVTAAVTPLIQGAVEGTGLAKNETFQKGAQAVGEWAKAHPDLSQNLQSATDIAATLTGTKAATTLGRAVEPSVSRASRAVTDIIGGPDGPGGAAGARAAVESIKTVAQGATDVAKMAGQGLARIPSRIGVNVAEKQAVEKAITSLPSKTAQTAVRDGVDIVDAQVLPTLVKTPQAQKLIQTVKDFASGNKTVDPIEIVGQPIISRVKDLTSQAKIIGSKLGDASKNTGILTKPELQSGVLARLKKVSGLEDVSLKADGTLDFKGTTFGSTLSRADKNAVQEAFKEATRWGDGKTAHMFRQTLFSISEGKKKSLANITDTHEKALEAIRGGLGDVIGSKNPAYKKLSQEYAKIADPLSQLRKLMKNIDPNSSEDILNMSAGLLARRITSAAPSNPQIRQLLQALDDAGTKGTTRESVTQMQDLYNILNKNYDIAPKTGFQNLVKEGVNVPSGLYDAASGAIKGLAGNTNAVRQASLEKYIEELLKTSKP